MKCPTCGMSNPSDAAFCNRCGAALPGLGAVVATGGRTLPCPGCGVENAGTAKFCKSCGRMLPHSWGDAAQAAADAAKTMPTSSSGRDPAGEAAQARRTAHLRRVDAERAERAALTPPPPSGRGELADLAAAEEWFTKVDAAWEELDTDLKQARAAVGMFPAADDLAEIADLQRRVDTAWASRQAAYAHRQRLWDQERLVWGVAGMGLPPGESW